MHPLPLAPEPQHAWSKEPMDYASAFISASNAKQEALFSDAV